MKLLLSAGTMPTIVNYENAVRAAGAEPVAAHCLPDSLEPFSGLILCGGGDIDPNRYGEENRACRGIDPERDALEFALLDRFIKAKKPVFGVCRGHQLLNVYFGGTLFQDLASASLHSSRAGDLIHSVHAKPGSILSRLYGREFLVNSAHHQGVARLGEGLIATGCFDENVIEACEHLSLPVFSVQWHPERLTGAFRSKHTKDGAKLFRYFVRLCARTV